MTDLRDACGVPNLGASGFSKVLGGEWDRDRICVHVVSPTVTLTEAAGMGWDKPKGEARWMRIPPGRFALAGETAAFPESTGADVFNGADLLADRGRSIAQALAPDRKNRGAQDHATLHQQS